MSHVFMLLPLVYHKCFRKLMQHLDLKLQPVGRSKLSQSLITTENQLVERSVIEMLEKSKATAISYGLCMICRTEEFFLLTAY